MGGPALRLLSSDASAEDGVDPLHSLAPRGGRHGPCLSSVNAAEWCPAHSWTTPTGTPTLSPGVMADRGDHAPVCTVGPFQTVNGGVCVDQSGNLWVPDKGASPTTVTEYGPDCGPPKAVLAIRATPYPITSRLIRSATCTSLRRV